MTDSALEHFAAVMDMVRGSLKQLAKKVCPKCGGCGETAPWDATISLACHVCDGTGEVAEVDA